MITESIVYCAGPQYSPEEKNGMLSIASLLEAYGFTTYLSSRDGLEYLTPILKSHPDVKLEERHHLLQTMNKLMFALEMFQVTRRCNSLFLNLNGRVPDEGSVFKASMAFSSGKSVTIYKNDNRSVFNGYDNSMIIGLSAGLPIVKKRNRIVEGLTKAIKSSMHDDGRHNHGNQLRPHVRRIVDFGEEIWHFYKDLGMPNNQAKDAYSKLVSLTNYCENAEGMRYLHL